MHPATKVLTLVFIGAIGGILGLIALTKYFEKRGKRKDYNDIT